MLSIDARYRPKEFLLMTRSTRGAALIVLSLLTPLLALPAQSWAQATRPSGGRPVPLEQFNDRLDQLFRRGVTRAGFVRYGYMRINADEVGKLVEALAPERRFPSNDHRVAFYVNAYNLLVINEVIRRWPVESVLKIEGFFDRIKHRVDGMNLTLDELEKQQTIPRSDARIHSVVVCAAVSCPPLRREAYRGRLLEAQLDDNARRWVNDPSKNRFEDGQLHVSKIFEWYRGDFAKEPFEGVLDFFRRYAEGALKRKISGRDVELAYLPYDWSLNDAD
jgi:hypothetical protein